MLIMFSDVLQTLLMPLLSTMPGIVDDSVVNVITPRNV